jgi:ankyrin repeat protein
MVLSKAKKSVLTPSGGYTALEEAARVDDISLVQRLLAFGVHPADSDALYWSAENANYAIFRALLDASAPLLRDIQQ